MLLRDNRQMAVSTVETKCFETADFYANAATKIGDPALAHVFEELSMQRGELAAELAAHIRAMDDLPQQPDPDREAVSGLLSSIKAFLSGDARAAFVHEREQGEDELIVATRIALQYDLPPETQSLLQRILSHSESAKERLASSLQSH